MAPVKTYKGKKPRLSLKVPPISPFQKEDPFDDLLGQGAVADVFSSSSEASALPTPEPITYDRNQRRFFELKDDPYFPTPVPSVSDFRGKIKKRAGKKPDFLLGLEELRKLKYKRRLRKRISKENDPVADSPLPKSSESFSITEFALPAPSSGSLLSFTELHPSINDSIVSNMGCLNLEEKSVTESSPERSPTGRSSIGMALATPDLNCVVEESDSSVSSDQPLERFIMIPGKKFKRSLLILRNIHQGIPESSCKKGTSYKNFVEEVILQNSAFCGGTSDVSVPLQSLKQRLSIRRSMLPTPILPIRHSIYETSGSLLSWGRSSGIFKGFLDGTLLKPGLPPFDSARASFKPDVSCTPEKDYHDTSPMASDVSCTPEKNYHDTSPMASDVSCTPEKDYHDTSPMASDVSCTPEKDYHDTSPMAPDVSCTPEKDYHDTSPMASVVSCTLEKDYHDTSPMASDVSCTLEKDYHDTSPMASDVSCTPEKDYHDTSPMASDVSCTPEKDYHDTSPMASDVSCTLEKDYHDTSPMASDVSCTLEKDYHDTSPMASDVSCTLEKDYHDTSPMASDVSCTPEKDYHDTSPMASDVSCTPEKDYHDTSPMASDVSCTPEKDYHDTSPIASDVSCTLEKDYHDTSPMASVVSCTLEKDYHDTSPMASDVSCTPEKDYHDTSPMASDVSCTLEKDYHDTSPMASDVSCTPEKDYRDTFPMASDVSCTPEKDYHDTSPMASDVSCTPEKDYHDTSPMASDVSCTPEKDYHDTSPMGPNSNISAPDEPLAKQTVRDVILKICGQTDFVSFSDLLKEECYDGASKLGEGVYAEVFAVRRGEQMTVIKIIPLEGNFCVNDATQKTYEEICPELLISLELNSLRYKETCDNYYLTHGFVEIVKIALVKGTYPPELLELWNTFNKNKGSDNDNPTIFKDDQIYIVIEQANGGQDLESYSFSTASQAVSVFKQIAFSLAVAECAMEFEHRDLHWGNVLVSKTKDKNISFWLKDVEYKIPTNGVKSTIIDYTLSRMLYQNTYPMSCDLSKDADLFLGHGDLQFDVYRLMKKDVDNEWTKHAPKTNARWLHYLLDKMKNRVKYQRKNTELHRRNMKILKQIESWIDSCESAYSAALQLYSMK